MDVSPIPSYRRVVIGGVEPTSVIEYPGELSAVLFTYGCSLRCPYCHNPQLVLPNGAGGAQRVPHEEIAQLLRRRRKVLDAVTVTGGEPLLHPDLPEYLSWIRSHGYKVKLDTNGTCPDSLTRVLEAGLVDYVAMDIKSSPSRYAEAAGVRVDLNAVRASIKAIIGSGVRHEFRSTVLPRLHDEPAICEMTQLITGAERYFLQTFRPLRTLVSSFGHERPFDDAQMEALAAVARKYVPRSEVR